MAPIGWLKIVDWKHDNNEVEVSKPYIERCFSTDWRKSKVIEYSTKSLNYFDSEANLAADQMQLRFNDLDEQSPFIYYDPYILFSDYLKALNFFPYNSIITSKSVVSKIMNTPFEINRERREWTIYAELMKNNYIYLYYDKATDDRPSALLAKQYELLKRHLFVKIPIRYYRKTTSVFSEIFGEIIRLKIGTHDLYYTSEIPGVLSDYEITREKELRTAEHVFCDVFKNDEFTPEVISYNPLWWSKAALINAKQCVLTAYDTNTNSLSETIKFNLDKFDDIINYENLWSPNSAWNFLNDFLRFVEESVKTVADDNKSKCLWKFQSFLNGKPFVTCETFIRAQENGKEILLPFELNPVDTVLSCHLQDVMWG
ncbi:hypothetical protein O3M35_007119 [Rhynocoris fuscipes]|uniref:RAI1-like domain-containing protein n=1 Tax=Rhynocoris fuscipes TaxID=488301 RepID=A0AAW1D8W3_9HEMI